MNLLTLTQSSTSKKNKVIFRLSALRLGLIPGLLLLLPFGQLLRLPLSTNATIYPHDVVLLSLVLVQGWIFWQNRRHGRSTSLNKKLQSKFLSFFHHHLLEIATVAYFGLMAILSWLWHSSPTQLLYLLRLSVYGLGLTVVVKSLSVDLKPWLNQSRLSTSSQSTLRQSTLPLAMFVLSLCLFAWLSFILYLVFPDVRWLAFFGWDDHYYRLIGTLLDPNFTGLLLGLGVLGTTLLTPIARRSNERAVAMAGLIFFSATLGLTFSRSSWLSFGLAISIWLAALIFSHQRSASRAQQLILLLAMTVLVALSSLLVAPKPGGEGVSLSRSASVSARWQFDTLLLKSLSTEEWLLGNLLGEKIRRNAQSAQSMVGQTTESKPFSIGTPDFYHPRTANNIWVTAILWGGLIGLALLIGVIIKWSIWGWRHSPFILAVLGLWLTHAQFNNSLLEPFCFLYVGGVLLLWRHLRTVGYDNF